jgi:enamine deaminase RidA (YjgF/YER057c/UK114 family)
MAFVKSHFYPGADILGEVFHCSSSSSFKVNGARIVAVGGQIGESADYSPFTPDGPDGSQFEGGHAHQFDVAMYNVERALAAASPHLSPEELWAGVYNMTSFHVGVVSQEEQLAIAASARKYLGKGDNKPAWAAICVAALFPPKCLIEIQVQAAYKEDA